MQLLMTSLSLAAGYVYEHSMTHSATGPRWVILMFTLPAFLGVILLLRRARKREFTQTFGVRVCRQCGANGPPHAMFCGNCGQRVKE